MNSRKTESNNLDWVATAGTKINSLTWLEESSGKEWGTSAITVVKLFISFECIYSFKLSVATMDSIVF